MTKFHNPMRQADWLRQTLAHDKKPLGVLLGAGCPMALQTPEGKPLIPDISGLTKVVAATLDRPLAKSLSQLNALLEGDNNRTPSIEVSLTFIRSLQSVAGKGKVHSLTSKQLADLDKSVCDAVAATVDRPLPTEKTAYHRLAAWVGATQRSSPVELFTTNYDLLLEQALETHRVPYFDGFVGSHRSFFDTHAIDIDELPARWARLWKMHGSINWERSADGSVLRHGAARVGTCVIHPSHLKYDDSRRMPYIALMDRLRSFLRQPGAFLVTCGFSFRDQHINEVILQALQGNPTSSVFALFRGELKRYPQAVSAGERRANLSILAADGAVIGTRRATWTESTAENLEATLAVQWSQEAPTASGGPSSSQRARFRLGDFSQLGNFLEDLIGSEATRENAFSAE